MAQYQPKQQTIEAHRIVSVEIDPEREVPVSVKLESGESRETPWSLIANYSPQPGDFYLIKPDGYVQVKSKADFLARYEPVPAGDTGA